VSVELPTVKLIGIFDVTNSGSDSTYAGASERLSGRVCQDRRRLRDARMVDARRTSLREQAIQTEHRLQVLEQRLDAAEHAWNYTTSVSRL
jgi:hypothetical protein